MSKNDEFTNEISFETFLSEIDTNDAYDAFIEYVWWGGGGAGKCGVIKQGHSKSAEGAIRSVPGTHEVILNAEYGKYLQYTLKNNYIFPVNKHLGNVSFLRERGGTKITWKVHYIPKFGLHWLVKLMLSMLPTFLSYLKNKTSSHTQQKGTLSRKLMGILVVGFLIISAIIAFSVCRVLPNGTFPLPLPPGKEYLSSLLQFRTKTSHLDHSIQKFTFLVIGGSGFVGSALVNDLLARGALKVRVLSRHSHGAGSRVLHPYPPPDSNSLTDGLHYPLEGVDLCRGDVTDIDSLRRAMRGVDVIFHTAASYDLPAFGGMGDGHVAENVNIGGMRNLLEVSRELGVKQIIYTSSCDTVFTGRRVVNATETNPFAENVNTTDNAQGKHLIYAEGVKYAVGDHYARTKIIAEKELLAASTPTLRTVSLRPNGIYGPGEHNNLPRALVPGMVLGSMPFYFDKDQRADWTCVYNLVFAHILAVNRLDAADMQEKGESRDGEGGSIGGRAYFITDMQSVDKDGNPYGAANWGIFKPILTRLGVAVTPWIRIPPGLFIAWTGVCELWSFWLRELIGLRVDPALTRKEALKVVTTHTHDCSAAKKELLYYPVFSTEECLDHTAEEMIRRFGRE